MDDATKILEEAKQALQDGWAWITVALVMMFMFVTRMRPSGLYNRGPDEVYFFGTDPYYHTRQTWYTVNNWPRVLGFDPWTQYPRGTPMGTFGTLFDQIAASLAWVVGLVVDGGMPTRSTVMDVLVAYPALIGALCILPLFFIARDMFGRGPAVYAIVAAGLIPGAFLLRSIAGFPDHHIMEVLFSTLALWAAYRAVQGFREADISLDETLKDPLGVWTNHRPQMATCLFAALAFWALMATWPPGVLFVFVAGGWLVLEVLVRVAREEDPGAPVVGGVLVFVFTSILMVPYTLGTARWGFATVDFSLLQPVVPLLVAGSLLGLALAGRAWRARDLPLWGYPTSAGVGGLAGLGLLALVVPAFTDQLFSGASWVFGSTMGWLPGLETPHTRLTISEAQPRSFGSFYSDFGMLAYTALAGWFMSVVDLKREGGSRDALLVVWGFFTLSAAMTQGRFTYFFAIAVLVLNAKLAKRLFDAAQAMSDPGDDAREADRISPGTGRAIVVGLLVLMLLPVNVMGFTNTDCQGDLNAWTQAACLGPNRESQAWWEEATWLKENTPQGGVDLAASYGSPDGRFAYPPEAYGVLSWWDYGHQIQWDGERAPVANPFQQQAPLASQIFTAYPQDANETSEALALDILDAYLGPGNQARYLMIDDAMVTGKFSAITVWSGDEDAYQPTDRSFAVEVEEGEMQRVDLPSLPDQVRSMFLQSIYREDASGFEHYRLVRENPTYAWIGTAAQVTEQGRIFLDAYNRVLGIGGPDEVPFPTLTYDSGDEVIQAGENQLIYDVTVESTLKTYEHVPGATLTGTASPGETIHVEAPLTVEPTGRAFTYEQTTRAHEDGTFNVTVPYSTTDPVPIQEGGTNTQVTATGPYTVRTGDDTRTVHVPDASVLDGETLPLD